MAPNVSNPPPTHLPCSESCNVCPDGVGSIESGEAFEQLAIACATKAGLKSGNGHLDQTIKKALETNGFKHFTLENFITWFEDTFSTLQGPAGTKKEITRATKTATKKRRPGLSSKGAGTGAGVGGALDDAKNESCLGELTWPDVSARFERAARVLYPIGLATYTLIVVVPKL